MTKKNIEDMNPVPVPTEVPSDTTLAPLGSAFDFLMQGIEATEVTQEQKFAIAELHVYMPGKKYTSEGATHGFVITYPDGRPTEINVTRLRLARMDAPIPQRLMWEFDSTGKRIQQEEPKPGCASSDGVSARKSDYFGFIGREFTDWRDGQKVTIAPDSCATCPLGQWKETFTSESDFKEPVIELNYKGQPYTRRSAPPCQELPAYVFFDLDRNMPLLYRTANYTHMQWIVGTKGRKNYRWNQIIKGVEEYYNTAKGTKRPDVSPENGVMLPLIFTTRMVENGKFGMTPAPQFTLGDTAMTEAELNAYATEIQKYGFDKVRKVISGEFWGLAESIANYADEAAGGAPVTAESPW